MKLDRARQKAGAPLLQKGDTYHAAGRKYRIVRVSGSTVTAEPIPTMLESLVAFGRSLAAPYRWAMRRRRKVATIAMESPRSRLQRARR
jgi:hypothetical protein